MTILHMTAVLLGGKNKPERETKELKIVKSKSKPVCALCKPIRKLSEKK